MTTSPQDVAGLARRLEPLSTKARLGLIAGLDGRKVFTTSLGIEDQVVTAAAAGAGAAIEIVTLDTGRLFRETEALIEETEERYGIAIRRFEPSAAAVDAYVTRYGRDGFYDSIEARHACCDVRKLRPLALALDGAAVWITGLRRGQSGARAETPLAEWDAARALIKVNPLADQSLDAIRSYAREHDVPLNPLHARGYPSIGCEPCTRAVKPGEPERAGRWWWEQDLRRECGLHVNPASSATSVQVAAS